MSDYSVTLSTTEPNNYVGLIKLRQGDVASQSIQATITANGQLFKFDRLSVFFNAVLPNGNVIRDKVTGVDYVNSKINYIVADSFLQEVAQVTAWFSFENDEKIIDSTKNFQYSVIGGWKECIPQGNYIYELSEIQREIEQIIGNKDFSKLLLKIDSIKTEYNYINQVKADKIELEKTKTELAEGLSEKVTKGKIRGTDLDTSSNEYKIKPVNISDELMEMFSPAGTVSPIIPEGGVSTTKYADDSLVFEKMKSSFKNVLSYKINRYKNLPSSTIECVLGKSTTNILSFKAWGIKLVQTDIAFNSIQLYVNAVGKHQNLFLMVLVKDYDETVLEHKIVPVFSNKNEMYTVILDQDYNQNSGIIIQQTVIDISGKMVSCGVDMTVTRDTNVSGVCYLHSDKTNPFGKVQWTSGSFYNGFNYKLKLVTRSSLTYESVSTNKDEVGNNIALLKTYTNLPTSILSFASDSVDNLSSSFVSWGIKLVQSTETKKFNMVTIPANTINEDLYYFKLTIRDHSLNILESKQLPMKKRSEKLPYTFLLDNEYDLMSGVALQVTVVDKNGDTLKRGIDLTSTVDSNVVTPATNGCFYTWSAAPNYVQYSGSYEGFNYELRLADENELQYISEVLNVDTPKKTSDLSKDDVYTKTEMDTKLANFAYSTLYSLNEVWNKWASGEKFPVVIFGDSTTDIVSQIEWENNTIGLDHQNPHAYPYLLEQKVKEGTGNTSMRVYNAGFSGKTLAWLNSNFTAILDTNNVYSDAKVAFISGGINDRYNHATYEEYYQAIVSQCESIINKCYSRGIQPVLLTTQVNTESHTNNGDIPLLDGYSIHACANSAKKFVAKKHNLELIDVYKFTEHFLQYSQSSAADIVPDKLHFTSVGHVFEAEVLFYSLFPNSFRVTEDSIIGYSNARIKSDVSLNKVENIAQTNGFKQRVNYDKGNTDDIVVLDVYLFNDTNAPIGISSHCQTLHGHRVIINDVETNITSLNQTITNDLDIGLHHIKVMSGTGTYVNFLGLKVIV
ncbi:BppU family phage baseplate upper protein [Lactococcus lactis]|uniref:BppU family phage baseplate upper protein n=1 Tax=Lactococcus lactis TaxID=1358 RepID=UPI0032AEC7A3